jgi:hypothetical protein
MHGAPVEHDRDARAKRVLYHVFKFYFVRSVGGLSVANGDMSAKDNMQVLYRYSKAETCLLGGYRLAIFLLRFMRRTMGMWNMRWSYGIEVWRAKTEG